MYTMETYNYLAVTAAKIRFPEMNSIQPHNEIATEARARLEFFVSVQDWYNVSFWQTILNEIDRVAVSNARKY